MRLVVIDTGFDKNMVDKYENFCKINGITIRKEQDNFVYLNDYNDTIGHGTIVCSVLNTYLTQKIELFIIKIFDKKLQCDVDLLIEALNYCCFRIKCDAIQISLGTLYTNQALLEIINKIASKGILIISAFDNEKCLSYPAAYPNVLGVDITSQYHKIEDFDIVESNIIDVRGADAYYRTKGLATQKRIVRGSSFYCSYILALIINENDGNFQKANVLNKLKKHAKCVYKIGNSNYKKLKEVSKAIVFPINKETNSIAAFERLIPFEIVDYFDIRQSGKVNKIVKNLLGYSENDKIIKNIQNLNWEDNFDTVICGHVGEVSSILGKDILEEISQKCLKYDKILWCFDNGSHIARKYPELDIRYPIMSRDVLPQYRFGKLRSPGIPIVGVFGTSARQGKMTIQLYLREAFKNRGFKIKNIGSEPESPLFGFEFSYVFGYGSTDLLNPQEMILTLNEAVFELEKENCDLIVAGSQSGTVAYQLKNLDMIPLKQYYFLLGVQPDSIILCINGYDSIEYVRRTILFFEATVKAKVICLCVSYINNKGYRMEMHPLEYFDKNLNVPVFDLMNLHIDDMVHVIQEFYAR